MTKAFVLAAGQGKRFLPFSEITPKALFKIGEISLIDRNLINLKNLDLFFSYKNNIPFKLIYQFRIQIRIIFAKRLFDI